MKEVKSSYQPVEELSKEYEEQTDKFKELDDEDFIDQTEEFLDEVKQDAKEIIGKCEEQSEAILVEYKNFLKYIGEEEKKMPFEDLLKIMKNFGTKLEVKLNFLLLIILFRKEKETFLKKKRN